MAKEEDVRGIVMTDTEVHAKEAYEAWKNHEREDIYEKWWARMSTFEFMFWGTVVIMAFTALLALIWGNVKF